MGSGHHSGPGSSHFDNFRDNSNVVQTTEDGGRMAPQGGDVGAAMTMPPIIAY